MKAAWYLRDAHRLSSMWRAVKLTLPKLSAHFLISRALRMHGCSGCRVTDAVNRWWLLLSVVIQR